MTRPLAPDRQPAPRWLRGAGCGLALLLIAGLLCACGGNTRAPVEDRYGGALSAREYRVQRGDTLYSISFRYGLDYRRVAAANGLRSPYTIYPGQVIALREANPARAGAAPAPVNKSARQPPPAPAASKPAPKPPASRPTAASGAGSIRWQWPSSGAVVRRYSGTVHKGIDIGGREGDPIRAVAAGEVVYAGTGIVGFGELLIVKHSATYLSAYGHNRRLLVSEGQQVKAGQQIAEKGSSGTDTVKLHFEIRRNGKPVDPLALLPPR